MSWIDNLSKNLIKNVEVTIGDNKTIAEMVDGNLKVEHYYKNEIIIAKPVRIGVNTISQTINSNRNLDLFAPRHAPGRRPVVLYVSCGGLAGYARGPWRRRIARWSLFRRWASA